MKRTRIAPSIGLGDTIEKIARITGIKAIVGKDCGCTKRKDDLNNRIVRDAWLKEHGGTAVKEENVWYWISPEPAPKKVNKKVANKRFF
mgnify:CR=1 FL=1